MQLTYTWPPALSALLLLAACGGSLSEADVNKAIKYTEEIALMQGSHGVWAAAASCDYEGNDYAFEIKIDDKWLELVPAPYTRAVVLNGKHSQTIYLSRVFFVALVDEPSPEKTAALLAQDFGPERLVIGTDTAYMYIPDTYGRGKLSNNFLEKKLGVAATTRNANTLRKMVEMAEEIGG